MDSLNSSATTPLTNIVQADDKDGCPLGDSWEEVQYRSDHTVRTSDNSSPTPSMIKLLLDAQRESSSSSSTSTSLGISLPPSQPSSQPPSQPPSQPLSSHSSRASPRRVHSPNTDPTADSHFNPEHQVLPVDIINNEWVWDWSSRPEIVPPSDWGTKYRHPSVPMEKLVKHGWTERTGSRIMDGVLFSLDHLPLLLLTHACSFILGAATILVYMKRYYN